MGTAFQITIDCYRPDRMAAFWSAALGYVSQPPPKGYEDWDSYFDENTTVEFAHGSLRSIVDPSGAGPTIRFVRSSADTVKTTGFNFDLRPGDEGAKNALITELEAAGARTVDKVTTPDGWWAVLTDPEGNEFSVL